MPRKCSRTEILFLRCFEISNNGAFVKKECHTRILVFQMPMGFSKNYSLGVQTTHGTSGRREISLKIDC